MANRDVFKSRERKYQCKLCPKRFTSSSVLTKHIRVHTGERPYQCKTCLRSFSQLTNLNRHQKIHIKEQTFECKYCDETFSQLSPLLRHETSHTVQETEDYLQDIPSVIPFRNQTAVPSSSNANSNQAGNIRTSVQLGSKNLTSLSNFLQIPSSNLEEDEIFALNQALSLNADAFGQQIQTNFVSGNIGHANNSQNTHDAILVSDESQESVSFEQQISPNCSEEPDVPTQRVELDLSKNTSIDSKKCFYNTLERNHSSFDLALRAPSDELEVIDIKPDLSALSANNIKLSPIDDTTNVNTVDSLNAALQHPSLNQDNFVDTRQRNFNDFFEIEQVPTGSIQYFKSESELCFDNNDFSENPSIVIESVCSMNDKDKPGLSARELSQNSPHSSLAVKHLEISDQHKRSSEVEVINLEDFSAKEMRSDEQHDWSVPLVDIQEITKQKLNAVDDFKIEAAEIEDGTSEENASARTKIKTNHLQKHIGPSECDRCRRPFSGFTNLKNQERKQHSKNGMLHCEYCEKTFHNSFPLLNHLKYHARSIQRNIKTLEDEIKQKQRKKVSKKSLKAKYLKVKSKSMHLFKKNLKQLNSQNSLIPVLHLKRSHSDPHLNAISPKNDENVITQDLCNKVVKKHPIGQKCLNSIEDGKNLMRYTSSDSFVENSRSGECVKMSGIYGEEEEDIDQIEFLFSVKASEKQIRDNTDSGSYMEQLGSEKNSSHTSDAKKSLQNDTVQIQPSELVYDIEYRENLAQKDILSIPSPSKASVKSRGQFHCKFCNKPFNRRFILVKHLRTHTGEKPFKCEFCSSSFSQSSNLNRHKKLHLPHGLFPCELCPAKFQSISELNTHNKKLHIGMKPLSCRICRKRFSHSNVLMAHLQTHKGEKRFVCELCNRAFTRATNLNRHMKIHVPGRVFRCRYCSHFFKQYHLLKMHLKTHILSGKTSNEDTTISKPQQTLPRHIKSSKNNDKNHRILVSNEQKVKRSVQSFQKKMKSLGTKKGSLCVSDLLKTNSLQRFSNNEPYEGTLSNISGTPKILSINGRLLSATNRLPNSIKKNQVVLNPGNKSISCNFDNRSDEDLFIKCESSSEKSLEEEARHQSQTEFDAAGRNSSISVLHLKKSPSDPQFNVILPKNDEKPNAEHLTGQKCLDSIEASRNLTRNTLANSFIENPGTEESANISGSYKQEDEDVTTAVNFQNASGDEDSSEIIYLTSNCTADASDQSTTSSASLKSGGQFHCKFCKKSFNRRFILIKHLRTHTGERPFKCEFCQSSFSQSSNLNRHKKLHLPHGLFPCKLCPARFPSISELNTHNKKLHIGMKPLSCRFCSKRFSHSSVLMAHLQTHTGEKRFVCELCNRAFTRATNLNRHMKIHISNGEGAGVSDRTAHENQAKSNSGSKDLLINNYETIGQFLKNGGSTTLVVSPSSSIDMKVETKDLNIEKQSGMAAKTPNSDSLRGNQSVVPIKEFSCIYCNKSFHHKQVLRRHLRSHHKSKMIKTSTCRLCDTSFPDADALSRHRKTCSHLLLPYFCNLCKEKFPNSSELSRHRQRKHSGGIRHFSCRYCSKVFAKNNALTKHIRTHTGEKPYVCELCQRPFSQATNLKRHQKIHARNGLFECKYCQASFSQLCHLSRHLHMHAGE